MAVNRTPRPLSPDQMLQDLKNASKNDVVFASIPPGQFKPKEKGLDRARARDVDKIATDSAKLVSAYNKLKDSHQSELPHTLHHIKQHIVDLKAVVSKSDET